MYGWMKMINKYLAVFEQVGLFAYLFTIVFAAIVIRCIYFYIKNRDEFSIFEGLVIPVFVTAVIYFGVFAVLGYSARAKSYVFETIDGKQHSGTACYVSQGRAYCVDDDGTTYMEVVSFRRTK